MILSNSKFRLNKCRKKKLLKMKNRVFLKVISNLKKKES